MMLPTSGSPGRFGLTFSIVLALSVCWAGFLAARSTGRIGECATSDGCDCHDKTPNANGDVTVTVAGPDTVDAGATNGYRIWLSGGPSGNTGGFNLCASGGTLIAGSGCKVDTGELTHSNGDNRFWLFEWIAPMAAPATYEFTAVAQATDGAQTSGDSWNWYGGAQGTPFTITVVPPTPVLPTSWGRLKARYR